MRSLGRAIGTYLDQFSGAFARYRFAVEHRLRRRHDHEIAGAQRLDQPDGEATLLAWQYPQVEMNVSESAKARAIEKEGLLQHDDTLVAKIRDLNQDRDASAAMCGSNKRE